MKIKQLFPSANDRIAKAAAAWTVRIDCGLTAAEQDEFLEWMAADPRHGTCFSEQRGLWQRFDRIAQWRPGIGAEPDADLLARPRSAARRFAPLALAAGGLIAALLWWRTPAVLQPAVDPTEISVVAAGQERRVLDDGSVVQLNPGAAMAVKFTAVERTVRLLRGEARFQVVKDPARSFVVRTEAVEVRAVGTAFEVVLGRTAVEVLVTEGRVQLSRAPDASRTGALPQLGAGERAVVPLQQGDAPVQVIAVTPEERARRFAWHPELLDFTSTPLAEVVAAFNRRNRVQLVLGDPSLAAVPMVASFRSDNVDGFVRLLEQTAGMSAERTGDTITLRRAPAAK